MAYCLYWPILNLKKSNSDSKSWSLKIVVAVSASYYCLYVCWQEHSFSHFLFWSYALAFHYFTEWKCSNKYIGVEPLRTYFKIPNTLFTTLMVRCHVLYVWCFLLLVHFQHWKKVLLRPNYLISSPYQHSLIIWFFHNTNIL